MLTGTTSPPEHLTSPLVFSGVCVTKSWVFCVLFCRTLFIILSFFLWTLYCMSLVHVVFFPLNIILHVLVSFCPFSFEHYIACPCFILSFFLWTLYCMSLFHFVLFPLNIILHVLGSCCLFSFEHYIAYPWFILSFFLWTLYCMSLVHFSHLIISLVYLETFLSLLLNTCLIEYIMN